MEYKWTKITTFDGLALTEEFTNVVSNESGSQLLVGTRSGEVYISKDFGVNWTLLKNFTSTGKEILPNCLGCSYDGKYIVVGLAGVTSDRNDSTVNLSNDNGVSFNEIKKYNDSYYSIKNITISNSGQYINVLLTDKTSDSNVKTVLSRSSDYGATFLDVSNPPNLYSITTSKQCDWIWGISITNYTSKNGEVAISTTNGLEWLLTGKKNINIEQIGYSSGYGTYFLIYNELSKDCGGTYEFLTKNKDSTGIAINYEGNYLLCIDGVDEKLYYSTDTNVSWFVTNSEFLPEKIFAYNGSGSRIIGIFKSKTDQKLSVQIGILTYS